MSFRAVVLDFDGTFTDVVVESEPFTEAFQRDLFDMLGLSGGAAQEAWARASAAIRDNPGVYGWRNAGVLMAPGNSDPYIFASCVGQVVCEELGRLRGESLRSDAMQLLYKRNYAHTRSAPRPDARAVLETLVERGVHVYVITNSSTGAVTKKIDGLSIRGRERVTIIGDAKKYVLEASPRDALFDALDELELPGLTTRKVQLRRGHYYDALRRCWDETGATPDTTLVCGDIFELDLALPLALGAHGHLVHREDAPDYELAYMRSHPRGGVSLDLQSVLARLEPSR